MDLLTEEHLSSLPKDLIEKAKTMSKAYEYMYCIENMIRIFLLENLGDDLKIPSNVQKNIDNRKESESKHKWLSLRGDSPLFYCDFLDLSGIILMNFEDLEHDFPNQIWIKSKLEDLSRFRNMIAHNSYIDNSDFELVRVYFNTISKQLNLAKSSKKNDSNNYSSEEFVKGLKHSKTYTYTEICNGIVHPLVYPLDLNVIPEFIKTDFEQISTTFLVSFKDSGNYIYPDFSATDFPYLEEYQENTEHLKIQIGQFDIDSDGMDEIFICLQVFNQEPKTNDLVINVFKYYPPALQIHANREENWKHFEPFSTGSIFGEPMADVNKNSICISRNYRHYYDKWTFFNGDFIHEGI